MTKTSQQTTDEITKAKVQLHLRLTYEDWKETFKQLRTRSEIGVLYAIRTLDPFGDRALDIDCTVLGDELGLHRTTVSDALKLLSEKKLIDLEITKARVKQKISNRRLTLLTAEENGSNQEQNEEKTMRVSTLTSESPHSQVSVETHEGGAALTSESPHSNQPPKSFSSKGFKNSQTIQTNSHVSHPLKQEGEEKKCFLGRIRSSQLSFATFEVAMNHIAEAIASLKDKSSAAAPPQTKLNSAKLQTDESFADAKTLRRLSKVTGLSVESLRTNVGLQKAIKSHPQNLEGVLDYLDAECKTFKPGIGFVVVALREGRSLANAGGAVFGEWIAEGEKRGLVAYSMSEGNDILISFRSGKTRFNEPQYYSQIKGMSWDEIAL